MKYKRVHRCKKCGQLTGKEWKSAFPIGVKVTSTQEYSVSAGGASPAIVGTVVGHEDNGIPMVEFPVYYSWYSIPKEEFYPHYPIKKGPITISLNPEGLEYADEGPTTSPDPNNPGLPQGQ